jgi:GNAT superfamily N-acetyltransferase
MAGLELPSDLRAAGIGLRPQTDDDLAFLERLYFGVRWEELAPLGWSDDAKRAFLSDQCRLQNTHYRTHYWDAEFLIIEHDGEPVGRLYIFRGVNDHRIVDISLMPDVRGSGIGTGLLQAVQGEAASIGKTVSIHVEKFNPAQTLYRRLGFREAGEDGPYWLMEWAPCAPAGISL